MFCKYEENMTIVILCCLNIIYINIIIKQLALALTMTNHGYLCNLVILTVAYLILRNVLAYLSLRTNPTLDYS